MLPGTLPLNAVEPVWKLTSTVPQPCRNASWNPAGTSPGNPARAVCPGFVSIATPLLPFPSAAAPDTHPETVPTPFRVNTHSAYGSGGIAPKRAHGRVPDTPYRNPSTPFRGTVLEAFSRFRTTPFRQPVSGTGRNQIGSEKIRCRFSSGTFPGTLFRHRGETPLR
jgi:hypothetical protein